MNTLHRLITVTIALTALNVLAATHYVSLSSANPTAPYSTWDTAATNIQQAVATADAGDEIVVTNGVYPGGVQVTNALLLRSANGAQFTIIDGGGTGQCVSLLQYSSLTGFTLTNGRGSVDGGGCTGCTFSNGAPGNLTNCVLTGNSGGRGSGAFGCALYNCSISNNSVVVSGPYFGVGGGAFACTLYDCTLGGNSAIEGGGAAYCWLTNCTLVNNSVVSNYYQSGLGGGAFQSSLFNCVLTGNSADFAGGGSSGCHLDTCTLTGNSAIEGGGAANCWLTNSTLLNNSAVSNYYQSGLGGGTFQSSLFNCMLTGNSADNEGGGSFASHLYNCTLTGNSAIEGGGAFQSGLYNSIVYFNTAPNGPNYSSSPRFQINYSCTMPMPTNGVGNITNAPLFVHLANLNLRLESNSPCINSGNNAYVGTITDLDGNLRISGGTVDMGAYEFQNPASSISYAWLQQYGMPTDGSADYLDPDRDGMNNWKEWICGTEPTDAASVLKMLSPTPSGSGVAVTWLSVTNRSYFLQRATNLAAQPSFSTVVTNIPGQLGTTTFIDTNAAGGPFFYGVGVHQ